MKILELNFELLATYTTNVYTFLTTKLYVNIHEFDEFVLLFELQTLIK